MKNVLLNSVMLMVTGIIMASIIRSFSGVPPQGVRVIISPALHDLGRVRVNTGAKDIIFEVHNASTETMLITGLNTSCGCTNARVIGSTILLAGEKRRIEVTFDQGDQSGEVQSSVSISAASPSGTPFTATARILSYGVAIASLNPKALELETTDKGIPGRPMLVKVQRGDASTGPWDGLEGESGRLLVDVNPKSADRFEVQVSVGARGRAIGPHKEDLKLYLTYQGIRTQEFITIPVRWKNFHSAIAVNPSVVFLGTIIPNGSRTGSILISSTNGQPLRGVRIVSDSHNVVVKLRDGASV